MHKPTLGVLILLIFSFHFNLNLSAQESEHYIAFAVPPNLKKNANASVRFDKTLITVKDYDDVNIERKRVVTVFSENGMVDMGTTVGYDSNRIITKLEARIYDAMGNEIEKFKKKDFEDLSAVAGGTLYSDNRVMRLRYTPRQYPFTVEFTLQQDYKSTAFLPRWFPLEGYHCSTQYSEFQIVNNSAITIRSKGKNLDGFGIEKLTDYHFKAKDLEAVRWEQYSPSYKNFLPLVKFAMTDFNMEGVRGINNNWQDFGKWMHDRLLTGTDDLSQDVVREIKDLTAHLDDPLEKAKVVYKYVQDRTRYISVQVGIGGWKPMLASDVERLGYADCKGLTNYTKALLNAIGVKANYAVIYGDRNITNIDSEFSLTEGNHAVLNIPTEDEDVWLECTSQTDPFGFIAGWTDDRDALLITPDGGKIVHTTAYGENENLKETDATVSVGQNGELEAEVNIKSKGYKYAMKSRIQSLKEDEQELAIKKNWSYLNNLLVRDFSIEDNRDDIEFTEDVSLEAKGYAKKAGNYFIFQINPFNRLEEIPMRYENRKLDLEIDRSQKEIDQYVFTLPEGTNVDALPDNVKIESKFGTYISKLEQLDKDKLKYYRSFVVNKGTYPSEEYQDFRDFMATVYKNDNAKIALTKEN